MLANNNLGNMARIIKGSNRTYTEKYPLLNGNRYLKVADPSIFSNKLKGSIYGTFKYDRDVRTVSNLFHFSSLTSNKTYTRLLIDNGLSALAFETSISGTSTLSFRINEIWSFLDKTKIYEYKLIVDGINNRIELRELGGSWVVYEEGSGLTILTGAKTTQSFTNFTVEQLLFGFGQRLDGGVVVGIGAMFNGNLYNKTIYDTDLVTPLYTLQTDGEIINANHTTTLIKNTVLDLQYNNSNVDTSDSPKTVTASGSQVYTDGLYGEALSARSFTGTQYDSWVNTENLTKYTVISWIKSNDIATGNNANYIINNNITSSLAPAVGNISIRVVKEDINIFWNKGGSTILYGARIQNVIELNKWTHIAVSFDSVNKDIQVFLNAKNITNQLADLDISGYVFDVNYIQALPLATTFVGGNGNLPQTTNCDMYINKIIKYIISAEELKAEFKKYSKI